MNSTIEPERNIQVAPPSLGRIAIATALAMIGAIVILVVAVLPAEYGIDPLGTGKAFGLADLAPAHFLDVTTRAGEHATLDGGLAHAVRAGASYEVYPPGTKQRGGPEARVGRTASRSRETR